MTTPSRRRDPFPTQIGCDLAAAEERIFGEHPIDLFHHRQRVCVDPEGRVIERRPAEPHQLALLADTELRVVPLDHRAFLLGPHRFSPSDKKIILDRQPPDLGVQLFHLGLGRAALLAAREHIGHAFDGLSLPCTDLVRMQLMLCRDLLHGLVTTQHFQRHLGLKLVCKVPALRHFRIPSKVWDTP